MGIYYTLEELKDAILRTAMGERHDHYNHTVDVAKFAHQIMTGDDQAELVVEYKRGEKKEAKKQRVHITNSMTRECSNAVRAQFEEMARVDNVLEQVMYTPEGQSSDLKKMEVETAMDYFHEGDSLTKYLHEALLHLNFYDPNAFIVCEARYSEDDVERLDKPIPYPREVYSEAALNYEFVNGVLGWMVAREFMTFKDDNDNDVDLPLFTLYAPEYNIQVQEIGDRIIIDTELWENDGWEKITITPKSGRTRMFFYKEYHTRLKVNPAIRVGYMKDPHTNRETCTTPLWPAHHLFKDMIWTKSEYDLCRALHGFYQKFIYAPKCEYKNELQQPCIQGRCGGEICPQCDGKGVMVHTTVQDVVILEAPRRKEDMVPLSNFVHYEHIPMDLIERHKEDLQDMKRDVMRAVFQRDLVDRDEVASTATEIRDIQSSRYNVIHTYGQNWSKIWKHIVRVIANYQDNQEGLQVDHDFSSDFIIETLSELFYQRQKAVEANAPYEVIHNIDRKIAMKQNRDNAEEIQKMEAKEKWKPLREKSEGERMSIIMNLPELHPLRIRYVYFEEIFSKIYSQKNSQAFHDLSWEGQKNIIDAIVNDLIEENRPLVERQQQFRNIFNDNFEV